MTISVDNFIVCFPRCITKMKKDESLLLYVHIYNNLYIVCKKQFMPYNLCNKMNILEACKL